MRSEFASPAGVSLPDLVRSARLPDPAERKRIRTAAGVSLRRMAAELGVSPMSMCLWERGEVEPRLDNAAAYRRLLDQLAKAVKA